ncbi:MAG: acyltransferase family protein [Deltaproteobacteria bacterium]|nr:acyltransferase family protein [Deltaproteobacteria bacterium]
MSLEQVFTRAQQGLELVAQFFQVSPAGATVDAYGRDLAAMELARPFANFLYEDYWRVHARGLQHIPDHGAALIVANHSGALAYDAVMIHMAIYKYARSHRLTRFLAENFLYYLPFLGTFINRLGGVRACPENAERLLHAGELVAVFPEGVKGIGKLYRDRYRLARFGRGGAVRLALKCGVPIIPCAVIGAEEIHPILYRSSLLAKLCGVPYLPITPTFPWLGPLGLVPLPSQWLIRFDRPISYAQYSAETADDPFAIHSLSEALRDRIQRLVAKGLRERERVVKQRYALPL